MKHGHVYTKKVKDTICSKLCFSISSSYFGWCFFFLIWIPIIWIIWTIFNKNKQKKIKRLQPKQIILHIRTFNKLFTSDSEYTWIQQTMWKKAKVHMYQTFHLGNNFSWIAYRIHFEASNTLFIYVRVHKSLSFKE